MTPSVAEEDKGRRGKVRAVFGSCWACGIWVTTWVLPLTFMIVMAWGCETHARQLGRRTLLYYDGEADNVLEAIKIADRRSDRGHDKRAIARDRRPVPVRRHPDRLRRLRPAHSQHGRVQLARCPRGDRRTLAGDRNRRHLQPQVGGPRPVAHSQANRRPPGHAAVNEPRPAPSEDRPGALSARVRSLVRAIEENDEAKVEEAILRLSRSRRVFAPLAFAIGAFALLFKGLRLLVSNWRLMLVQILPAMWIWLAMYDLKAHVLRGKSFNVLRGPVLIPIVLAIVTITVASFFLNAVFAFAILRPARVEIRAAVARARLHWLPIVISGATVGLLLGFSTMVVTRWGRPWFTLSLGIVVGVMMVSYVTVPARLIGAKRKQSRRDRLSTSVVGGALGATICTPPYILGRLGILMLGSSVLFIPGILVLAVGVTLQAGATGAVRAIKMSATLTTGQHGGGPRTAPEEHLTP